MLWRKCRARIKFVCSDCHCPSVASVWRTITVARLVIRCTRGPLGHEKSPGGIFLVSAGAIIPH